ncbi:hypothetical protein [Mesorhizobium sp. B1-1-5]|uniref:hypothetical protein n=1 Tax=Mesorhizobium sp. B1-1-5 TaxID=2589979 RepID=UPI001128A6F5|nr:hypothetical protein [Mesorhizobium sp. B1-1-5]TPO13756.1 hypothetical protein FJ980_00855 [Mesorhizobium sp. B1-1-5]
MIESKCFLCEPDADLLVTAEGPVFTMVGLGPVSPTYVIVASQFHLPSLADLAIEVPAVIDSIFRVRRKIESIRGPLVMTEHGRVPVCRDYDDHEKHCFHGHALLFGVNSAALDPARDYYSSRVEFDAIGPALAYAAQQDAYLLVSRSPEAYEILSGPLNAPRQLARTLAAIGADEAQAADWRISPRRSDAVMMAAVLRTAMELSK